MSERFWIVEEVERLRAEVIAKDACIANLKEALDTETLNNQIEELKSVLTEIVAISDRKHDAWDKAKVLLGE